MLSELIVPIIVAAIVAIPSTFVAVAGWLQAKVAAKKTDENTIVTVATREKTDEIAKTSVEIRGLADGHLTKVTEQLEEANAKLVEMGNKHDALQKLFIELAKEVKKNGNGGEGVHKTT